MALLRPSRARYNHVCNQCSRTIKKGDEYYRSEPHPMDRMKRGAKVSYLCLVCIHGQEYVDNLYKERRQWLKNYWVSSSPDGLTIAQQSLFGDEPIEVVRTTVEVTNITHELLPQLSINPDRIYTLPPTVFEELICDRLQEMNYGVERVGSHTYQRDGGIDIVAWPKFSTFPFLMAVQAKHHRSPEIKTGSSDVRDLLGVIQALPFNAGVLVTNTTFTPDAKWFAKQRQALIRLRDFSDIKRWLENNYLDDYDWREMPETIEVCPGIVIHLPKHGLTR